MVAQSHPAHITGLFPLCVSGLLFMTTFWETCKWNLLGTELVIVWSESKQTNLENLKCCNNLKSYTTVEHDTLLICLHFYTITMCCSVVQKQLSQQLQFTNGIELIAQSDSRSFIKGTSHTPKGIDPESWLLCILSFCKSGHPRPKLLGMVPEKLLKWNHACLTRTGRFEGSGPESELLFR